MDDVAQTLHGQAGPALEASEDRYRRLFAEATEGIALADFETGEIVECNRALLDLLGYARDEVVGRHQRSLHPPEPGSGRFSREFALHRGERAADVLQSQLVTRWGQIRDVEIKAQVIEIDGRKLMQGFFRDRTDARRQQREREAMLALLRLLNDQSHTRDLLRSLTRFLQEWTGCEAVGVRLQEDDDYPYFETRGFPPMFVAAEQTLCEQGPDGRSLRDPQGHPMLVCMCGNVLRGRTDPTRPYFTPKGTFWTNSTTELLATTTVADRGRTRNRCHEEGYESVALIPLRHGNQTLGLIQLNDSGRDRFSPELISFLEGLADQIAMALAQRQAQAALRLSEEKYRQIVSAASEGIWVLGPDFRTRFVNERMAAMLGYASEELLGGSPLDLLIPEEREQFTLAMDRYRQGHRVRVPRRYLSKQGHEVWVLISGVPLFDAEGRFEGVLAMMTDITAQRRSEEEQRRLQDQLTHTARLSTAGEMVAGIAHEVNQPLYSILNYAKACSNLLERSEPPLDQLRQWSREIAALAARTGEIIQRLRGFVRRSESLPLPADLNELVSESLALLRHELGRGRIAVRTAMDPALPPVHVDRVQIQQVLVNLVRNACEAMEAVAADRRQLTVRTAGGEGQVEVAVIDRGPGLSGPAKIGLFEPFVTTKPDGLGMGLAISRSIVEAHGGRIRGETDPEGGMIFRFSLPVQGVPQ